MKTQKDKPEVLAIIPARGGSKSIPRKNIIKLAGKPLISYSIEQALSSKLITRTIVSTDDTEIAKVSSKYGAELPFIRPSEFAQDLSPDVDVFFHALTWLLEKENYSPELVVHLRPTGPVRRVELIDQAIQMMLESDADSLRSVSFPEQTPYKMWHIEDGLLKPLMEVPGVVEPYCMPRQSLPQVFWQNGYVDIIRSNVILQQRRMCGNKVLPFIVNEPMLEIDYEDNLPEVEKALKKLKSGELPELNKVDRHPV